MEIRYAQRAIRDLEEFPRNVQKRIAAKMRFYAEQKEPLKFAKRLVNPDEGEFRFRVGDHRVFFDVVRNTIVVLKISRRDQAYE